MVTPGFPMTHHFLGWKSQAGCQGLTEDQTCVFVCLLTLEENINLDAAKKGQLLSELLLLGHLP